MAQPDEVRRWHMLLNVPEDCGILLSKHSSLTAIRQLHEIRRFEKYALLEDWSVLLQLKVKHYGSADAETPCRESCVQNSLKNREPTLIHTQKYIF